ncbi:MAG: nucleotidyltransferase family protein [Candidatus Omnitrophica bacterium]|nr:nucleotidyltransferase family protein [Candidatus Omnitrophota bacterium]
MKALILAGGYGTRLHALGKDTPKALLEVGPQCLLEYIIEEITPLESLKEILLVTNNKFYQTFRRWADDYGYSGKIRIINDGTNSPEDRLGSIGDIDFVIRSEQINDDLLVIGGDNLFDGDLRAYSQFAKTKAPLVTIGLYNIGKLDDAKRFGVVALDSQRKIISFEEKPAKPRSTLIAMCLYYFPQKSLGHISDYLLESGKSDTAGDYIRWLSEQLTVYGFEFHGKWYDIGSVESYREAQNDFRAGEE